MLLNREVQLYYLYIVLDFLWYFIMFEFMFVIIIKFVKLVIMKNRFYVLDNSVNKIIFLYYSVVYLNNVVYGFYVMYGNFIFYQICKINY